MLYFYPVNKSRYMTRSEFIEKYNLQSHTFDGTIDCRTVIFIATANLSDTQDIIRYNDQKTDGLYFVSTDTLVLNKINDVKAFLFDWNKVLKTEEREWIKNNCA